jgi:hypothetical protein
MRIVVCVNSMLMRIDRGGRQRGCREARPRPYTESCAFVLSAIARARRRALDRERSPVNVSIARARVADGRVVARARRRAKIDAHAFSPFARRSRVFRA